MTTPHPFDRTNSDREALSALFDGELVGDAARFALKRLDHDQDWRETCERWTVVGDVLRGQGGMLLPAGFPSRVRAAMAAEPVPAQSAAAARPRWAAWSGLGLAASAAAVALFFAGQNDPMTPASPPDVVVAAPEAAPPPSIAPAAPAEAVAQLATAGAAVVGASRQAAQRSTRTTQASEAQIRESRSREARGNRALVARASAASPRASANDVARAAEPGIADRHALAQATSPTPGEPTVAVTAPIAPQVTSPELFGGQGADRPWPRAVLPQYGGGNGALTADFGARPTPSFYPFEPRLPREEGDARATASPPASP